MAVEKQKFKKKLFTSIIVLTAVTVITFSFGVVNIFADDTSAAAAQNAKTEVTAANNDVEAIKAKAEVTKFSLIAAAIAFGFGAIGAGIAVGNVGSAAMGAIGEKPELGSQALIFVALAEGLAVFGLIIAILILGNA